MNWGACWGGTDLADRKPVVGVDWSADTTFVVVTCRDCGKRLCLEAEQNPDDLAMQAAGRVAHDDCSEGS